MKHKPEIQKKVIIGIGFFFIGLVFAMAAYPFFRLLIQDLFQWTTNNGIQLIGKDFYFIIQPVYYISFGITFLFFSITMRKGEILKPLRNGIVLILIFGIVLIGICVIDANLKIMSCTACSG